MRDIFAMDDAQELDVPAMLEIYGLKRAGFYRRLKTGKIPPAARKDGKRCIWYAIQLKEFARHFAKKAERDARRLTRNACPA